MKYVSCVLIGASICAAQEFSARMPAGVPEIAGAVEMRAPLRYIDVKDGTGPAAQPGQEYTVHYTGWLRDGTKFDSSVDRGQPFKFVQGRRQVISGWEMGFEGMKAGGKRRLFLPYQLAYGERGRGKIPPKAELIFDVELLGVKDVPNVVPGAELLLAFEGAQNQVLQLARVVPEEKYGWRPAPGVRSFKEVFLHIVNGDSLLQHISEGLVGEKLSSEIEANAKAESDALTKDQVIAKLTESFAAVRKAMEDATAGSLSREAQFFGRTTTARGIYTVIDTHIAEHLGQLIAYCRMNGIVPPWSK
ncbi:MAG TPA: DinB family protein [Candidatus Solibacter sp.]|nr:DinB family protein [Candidatus Solibacter sp.]